MPRFDLILPELESFLPDIREPADFDAFWAETIAEARSLQAEVTVAPVNTALTQIDVFDVTFAGYGGSP